MPDLSFEAPSMAALLRDRAARHPERPLIVSDEGVVTYGTFDARTDELAAGLGALGVRRGDVVSVFLPNCVEYLETWWATLKLGAVFGPVNSSFTGPEAAYVVGHSGAVAAVCDASTAAILGATRDALPALRHIVTVDGGGDVLLDELRDRDAEPPAVEIAGEDLAAIVYTSGSTGRPKGAMLTHRNYLADASMICDGAPLLDGDRIGLFLPLFHVNAQVVSMTTALVVGGSVALWDFSARDFWATVDRLSPVFISTVPTILNALLHAPGADAAQTNTLRVVGCGAAPLSRSLMERFEAKFQLRVIEGYGLTEATAASSLNPFYGQRKAGSIGLPLRGQEMRVARADGSTCEPGEAGEILLRGPNVMLRYFRDPEATAEALRGGWLWTGDIGYADEDGYFFLVDRSKDMIIRGGENIYPREIEEVLAAVLAVREVAVVGIPDAHRGEAVHAVVSLTEGAQLTLEELTSHTASRLAAFKQPTGLTVLAELPKNPTGKIDKPALRRMLA